METQEKFTVEKILKDEQFGKPISEKLSNYLRQYTDKDDRADVSIQTGVGTSTIRNVVFRSNTLTEDNSRAIVALVEIALTSCREIMEKASEAIDELQEVLLVN